MKNVPVSGTNHREPQQPGTLGATRVADILLEISDAGRPIGVTEIARNLAMSKAVVHRILQSLLSRELVTHSAGNGAYTLGPAAAAIGARALQSHDLRTNALPTLRRLQAETGETATVSSIAGSHRVYLEQVVSPQQVKMTVELGRLFPLYAGASGKAMLAFADEDLRATVLSRPLERISESTITDRAELEADLERVRERGYATSQGERLAGTVSVAAPVFWHDLLVGAVSVCGPRDRFDAATQERYGRLLVEACAAID